MDYYVGETSVFDYATHLLLAFFICYATESPHLASELFIIHLTRCLQAGE